MEKVIDFHTHIGKDKDENSCTPEQLLRSMSEAKITHSVVFPLNEKYLTVEEASMRILYAVQEKNYPFYPFFRFDPKRMTPEILGSVLRNKNFYGVKLHPRSQNFFPLEGAFSELYRAIERSGKPLLFHTRKENNQNSDPDVIMQLAEYFPKLNLIIGHFGNVSLNLFTAAKEHKRLYLETSVLGSTPYTMSEYAVKYFGEDRVIFGSDIPYSDQLIERLKIDRSSLSRQAKRKILYKNAARLLGLE